MALRYVWLASVSIWLVACDSGSEHGGEEHPGTTARTASSAASPEALAPRRITIHEGPIALAADILIPRGNGPFPAVVYNHGSERAPSLEWLGNTARWLQQEGYVALFPYRRGRPGSGGEYWEDGVNRLPKEQRPAAMLAAFEAELDDVQAGVRFLRKHPR